MKYYVNNIWRLWIILSDFHIRFYLQLFYILSIQFVNIYVIYLGAQIINKIVEKDFTSAYTFAIYILSVNCLKYFLMFLQDSQHIKYIENGVNTFLQNYSLKKILKLNPSQFIEDHSAIKLIVISRGEEAVKLIITIILFELIPTFSMVLFSTLAIFLFSPIISLTTIAIFITAFIWTFIFSRYHQKFIKQNIENWDVFNKNRSETFQHLQLIKNSGVENKYLKRYIENRVQTTIYDIFTWMKVNINGKLRITFFSIGKFSITLQLIYQTFLNKLLIGDVFAIWSWSNQSFDNMVNIVRATRNLPKHFVELEKYLNIVDLEPAFNENGRKEFASGDIEFSDVSFKYQNSTENVIDTLNLVIPQGKKTAFVGFSGSGKSTIVKLLLRTYDWIGGDITINGISLRKFDARILRQKIGYVEQHVDLFDTSIRDNILFGLSTQKISQSQLSEIVHKSRIDQFFHRLGTAGLDTTIGERGVKLSGGERQRIGIARALVKNPEILIFDEATASLDTENEKYIQEAIDDSSVGRTTIIVAHRLSTVQNADKIIVMDKGKIVGEGTHDFLKNTCPEYQRLIYAQEN